MRKEIIQSFSWASKQFFSPTTLRVLTLALVAVVVLQSGTSTSASAAADDEKILKMATTTSTENSGLLGFLIPRFEAESGIQVRSIAVGTGKALRLGEMGDVDVVMVHAKNAEEEFLSKGYGTRREEFMYNDFVIVGPPDDPAQIRELDSATDALAKIASTQSMFISRGDDSGTHKRELSLWRDTGVEPGGAWYREAGQGMGKVLQISSELQGYTLTDRGTWLNLSSKTDLTLLLQADPKLFNHYGVIPVSPTLHPHVNNTGAEKLTDWLISETGQNLIGQYTINGQQAFIPSRLAGAQ